MIKKILFLIFILTSVYSQAVQTEFGLSHSYRKTSFDKENYVDSQMSTASISFYLWQRIALELSYSEGTAVRKEYDVSSIYPARSITQKTVVYGSDLILGFGDKTSRFQPFIKGGVAYIKKEQIVKDDGLPSWKLNPDPGVAPSYGVGIKIKMTDSFSLSASWDNWQTPVDGREKTLDTSARLGIVWSL